MTCNCGIPRLANYYVYVVIGNSDDTTYADGYACAEHWDGQVRPFFGGLEGWKILERKVTKLR